MHSETIVPVQDKRSFIETSRRAQIIACAIDAIAELGFARASLAQIAKRAGVSTGVILYYYAGKDALIREVAAHVFAAGEALIAARIDVSSARAALRSFVEASVAYVGACPNNIAAMSQIIRAGDPESGPRFDPAVMRRRRDGFETILTQGQALGEFRTFDVSIMATTIIEAVDAVPVSPGLNAAAYGAELAELFDRATRADPHHPSSQEHAAP